MNIIKQKIKEISRSKTNGHNRSSTIVSAVDRLEDRRLFAGGIPRVTQVIADNRGEVLITVDESIRGVARSSVQILFAGADGRFNTGDDVNANVPVSYNDSTRRINIRGNIPANRSYRIFLNASRITSVATGARLDGENTGTQTSGNGFAGGNFIAVSRANTSSTPTVRMSTTLGTAILRLRRDLEPITTANFLSYANSRRYDNIFFTRSENSPSPFVIQGGSLQITGSGTSASDVVATTRDVPIGDERDGNSLSNVISTLSFAKGGPNSVTNQFFVNLADNSFLDGQGFTPFAEVTSGLSIFQQINQQPLADLNSQIGTVAGTTATGVGNAPVQNTAQAQASLNPVRDFTVIRRVAVQNRVTVS